MEASPDRPGHVGHTPQHVSPMLRSSRLAGLASSVFARAFGRDAHAYALQPFPRLTTAERQHPLLMAVQIERQQQRLSRLQPWPWEFEEGFAPELVTPREP